MARTFTLRSTEDVQVGHGVERDDGVVELHYGDDDEHVAQFDSAAVFEELLAMNPFTSHITLVWD